MVTTRYCTWKCPVCRLVFTSAFVRRHIEVWCEGQDHSVRMEFEKEEYL